VATAVDVGSLLQLQLGALALSGCSGEVRLDRTGGLVTPDGCRAPRPQESWAIGARTRIVETLLGLAVGGLADLERTLRGGQPVTLPEKHWVDPTRELLRTLDESGFAERAAAVLKRPDESRPPAHVSHFAECLLQRIRGGLSTIDAVPGLGNVGVMDAWVDMALRRSQRSRLPQLEGATEPTGRPESLRVFLERFSGSALIQGDPGSGKTTLLSVSAALIAAGAHRVFGVPLLLPCRSYLTLYRRHGDSSVVRSVVRHVGEFDADECNDLARRLERWASYRMVTRGAEAAAEMAPILLVDGLDELGDVPPGECLEALAKAAGLLPVIFTSRPGEPPRELPSAEVLAVQPLDLRAAKQLTENLLSAAAADILRKHLDEYPELRDLARNPFILTALCGLAKHPGGRELPTGRIGLYEAILQAVGEHFDARNGTSGQSFAVSRRLIERLALGLLCDVPDAPRLEFSQEDVARLGLPADLLPEVVSPSRLARRTQSTSMRFEFLHASMHEYLASTGLLYKAQAEEDAWLPMLRHPHHVFWRSGWAAIASIAGERDDPEEVDSLAAGLTGLAGGKDRFGVLATIAATATAACAGRNSGMEELRKRLKRQLEELLARFPRIEQLRQAKSLLDSEAPRPTNLKPLLLRVGITLPPQTFAEAEQPKVSVIVPFEWRESIRMPSGGSSDVTVIALRALAAATSQSDREFIIDGLVETRTVEGRDALLAALAVCDPADAAWRRAIGKMHQVPCGVSAPLLLGLAQDPAQSEEIRAMAIRGLTQSDRAVFMDMVLDMLRSEDTSEAIALACGKTLRDRGTPEHLAELLQMSSQSGSRHWRAVVEAVAGIADRHPRTYLIARMENELWAVASRGATDNNVNTQRLAVTALMPRCGAQGRETLTRLCESAKSYADRSLAAIGLARCDKLDERAVAALTQAALAADSEALEAPGRIEALIDAVTKALLVHAPEKSLSWLHNDSISQLAAQWSHSTGDLFFDDVVVRASEPLPERFALRPTSAWDIKKESREKLLRRIERHSHIREMLTGERLPPAGAPDSEVRGEAILLRYLGRNWPLFQELCAAYEERKVVSQAMRYFVSGPKILAAVGVSGVGQNIVNTTEPHKRMRALLGILPKQIKSEPRSRSTSDVAPGLDKLYAEWERRRRSDPRTFAKETNGFVDQWIAEHGDEHAYDAFCAFLDGMADLVRVRHKSREKAWLGVMAWWVGQGDPRIEGLKAMIGALPRSGRGERDDRK